MKRQLRGTAAIGSALIIGLAGCSSGSGGTSSPSPTPTPSPSVSASASPSKSGETTAEFNRTVQQELNDVGCYAGAPDGVIGPETDAAVLAFQEASGLEADGELGPETDAALKKAASEGKTVCTTAPTKSPTASPTTTSAKAACTATSIQAALQSGEVLESYSCANTGAEQYAAGSQSNKQYDSNFFLQADGGAWKKLNPDEICGTASAGLPPSILKYCDAS